MSTQDNGGPAFPDPQEDWRGEKGMTLRDYFAAKAMQGCIASGRFKGYSACAADSYAMADAMLKARQQ